MLINLNQRKIGFYYNLKVPITAKFEETFYLFGWICCLPSGPLRVDVDAPVRGYAPGQTINVEIDVSNDSNEVLSSLDVQLIQVNEYHFNYFWGVLRIESEFFSFF